VHAALGRGVFLVWLALAQARQPLRKSDLIRHLSGSALSRSEIADLIRRNCLSFRPTERDRADLRSLGADAGIFRRIEECLSRRTAATAAPSTVTRSPPPTPAPTAVAERQPRPATPPPSPVVAALPVAPPAVVSASRTGFVLGVGQRGRVGTRLPVPLVFEVRDTTNAPVVGRTVVFLAAGARLEHVSAATDSSGRASAIVALGQQAGSVVVSARVGAIERQVALQAVAGPPAKLEVRCGGETVESRLTLRPDTISVLRIVAQDAYGNPVPLTALRAAVGDDRVLRQVSITADSLRGAITFRPGKAGGATNLAIQASGVRVTLIASVPRRGSSGAGCG